MERVRRVHRLLVEEVEPYEEAEEKVLSPALGRVLGGSDPTGTMSRAHVEIAHQIRRLGQVLEDIGPEGPDQVDIAELRRILYGCMPSSGFTPPKRTRATCPWATSRDHPRSPRLGPEETCCAQRPATVPGWQGTNRDRISRLV